MGTLANISAYQAIRAFGRIGYLVQRQSGSHIILAKPGGEKLISVPERREVPLGLLRGCIRDPV